MTTTTIKHITSFQQFQQKLNKKDKIKTKEKNIGIEKERSEGSHAYKC